MAKFSTKETITRVPTEETSPPLEETMAKFSTKETKTRSLTVGTLTKLRTAMQKNLRADSSKKTFQVTEGGVLVAFLL